MNIICAKWQFYEQCSFNCSSSNINRLTANQKHCPQWSTAAEPASFLCEDILIWEMMKMFRCIDNIFMLLGGKNNEMYICVFALTSLLLMISLYVLDFNVRPCRFVAVAFNKLLLPRIYICHTQRNIVRNRTNYKAKSVNSQLYVQTLNTAWSRQGYVHGMSFHGDVAC